MLHNNSQPNGVLLGLFALSIAVCVSGCFDKRCSLECVPGATWNGKYVQVGLIEDVTSRIDVAFAGQSTGDALARIVGTGRGVIVDGRFEESNVWFSATNISRGNIGQQLVRGENISVSPSGKLVYIGPDEDAERAREAAQMLQRRTVAENIPPRCISYRPSRIGKEHSLESEWLGVTITVQVTDMDPGGVVQGCRASGGGVVRTTLPDYYWSMIALSSTRLRDAHDHGLVIIPAATARPSPSNTWSKFYWHPKSEQW